MSPTLCVLWYTDTPVVVPAVIYTILFVVLISVARYFYRSLHPNMRWPQVGPSVPVQEVGPVPERGMIKDVHEVAIQTNIGTSEAQPGDDVDSGCDQAGNMTPESTSILLYSRREQTKGTSEAVNPAWLAEISVPAAQHFVESAYSMGQGQYAVMETLEPQISPPILFNDLVDSYGFQDENGEDTNRIHGFFPEFVGSSNRLGSYVVSPEPARHHTERNTRIREQGLLPYQTSPSYRHANSSDTHREDIETLQHYADAPASAIGLPQIANYATAHSQNQVTGCHSHPCLYIRNGNACGETIVCDTVPEHFSTMHGVKRMKRDVKIFCEWENCGSEIQRHNFIRHIRGKHLGHKRR